MDIIHGPHEPKLTINSYLVPLVAKLNLLWKDGITERGHGALTGEVYHAALVVMYQLQGKCVVLQGLHRAKAVQNAQDISLAQ